MHLLNFFFAFFGFLALVAGAPPTDATLDESYNTTIAARGFPSFFPNVEAQPTFGAPYCRFNHPERGDECILTTRMTGPDDQFLEFYLFDHNCVMIGANPRVPYFANHWDFFSQLPYSVVIGSTHGGQLGFWYAGRYIEPKTYRKFTCYNTGNGNPRNILPACQIHWDCHS